MRKDIQDLLRDKKRMKEESLFVVDTEKILKEVVELGFEIIYFGYDDRGAMFYERYGEYLDHDNAEKIKPVFLEKYVLVTSHQHFIAIVKAAGGEIENIKDCPSLVILDNIQDPSNVGAIIRSGAAFGFRDYLLINCAYVYNEKTIRASAGAIFVAKHKNITKEELPGAVKGFKVIASSSHEGEDLRAMKKPAGKIAIALGSEGQGLDPDIEALAAKKVMIQHADTDVESLNVAAAAAVIFYQLSAQG